MAQILTSNLAQNSMPSFMPPRAGLSIGGIVMALLVHGFLVAALTWGINWRSQPQTMSLTAELWGELPQEAAAALTVPPPVPESSTAAAPVNTPDIVNEKAKAQAAAEQREKELKLAAEKKKLEEANRLREQMRQDQIKRMAGMAGATGSSTSTGTALQSTAPSSSYGGKVKAKVKPNIVFQDADSVNGDPTVEIAIRLAPDGTVLLPLKVVKASGNPAWDSAVMRGIEKTETLPRDSNGKFPGPFTLVWHLKE